MSNYLPSVWIKQNLRFFNNIEATTTWEIKSTQETLFFSPYLKEKINRKRSQILFTLSVLMHPAEKHTYLCNWLTTENITRTWIVKQTPLNKIMSISKTVTNLLLPREKSSTTALEEFNYHLVWKGDQYIRLKLVLLPELNVCVNFTFWWAWTWKLRVISKFGSWLPVWIT